MAVWREVRTVRVRTYGARNLSGRVVVARHQLLGGSMKDGNRNRRDGVEIVPASARPLLAGVQLNVATGQNAFGHRHRTAIQTERDHVLHAWFTPIVDIGLIRSGDAVDLARAFDVPTRLAGHLVRGDAGAFHLHAGAAIDEADRFSDRTECLRAPVR